MEEPLTNGGGSSQRDAQGRFVPGNRGGPGNPFAGRVTELRTAALEAVPADRIHRIFDALAQKAEGGDVRAAKVVLAYALGRPVDEAGRAQQEAAETIRQRFGDDLFG